MKNYIPILIILFLSAGCASQQPVVFEIPDKHNPSLPEADNKSTVVANIDVKVVDYNLPKESASDDKSTKQEDSKSIVSGNNFTYTISPTKADFSGGAVIYNYIPNHIYRIFLTPLKLVDIQLESGEKIMSPPACGDTTNFVLGTSSSFVNNLKQEHVYLKCVYANKETTLAINTDRRVYQLSLHSYTDVYMPIVSFNYPIDSFETMKREVEEKKKRSIYLNGSITDFNFSYEIVPMSVHKPAWMPSVVFDDGKKTYLHFASAKRAAYAPVLFIIEDGKRILCNYRVIGDYYMVDQTFDRAELVLDINAGNIVSIIRQK